MSVAYLPHEFRNSIVQPPADDESSFLWQLVEREQQQAISARDAARDGAIRAALHFRSP
jgi:hypothetical protein